MTDQPTPNSNLFKALALAQGEFPVLKKNAKANAGKFGYGYVTLDVIIEAIRAPFAKHGLGFYQEAVDEPAKGVITTIFHESGESLTTFCPYVGSYQTMQQLGSCITYARRYGLQNAVGVFAEEDDDGAAATAHNKQKPQPPRFVVTDEMKASIARLQEKAGVDDEAMKVLLSKWGLESLSGLSKQQYAAIITRLNEKAAEPKPEPTPEPESDPIPSTKKPVRDVRFSLDS